MSLLHTFMLFDALGIVFFILFFIFLYQNGFIFSNRFKNETMFIEEKNILKNELMFTKELNDKEIHN